LTYCWLLTHSIVAAGTGEPKLKFYDPVSQTLEGWTIKVDPALLQADNGAIKRRSFTALANHLQRVKFMIQGERLEHLQQLPIWIEFDNASLDNMQYHPSRGWLIANGHDPRLAKHVHIPHAATLTLRETWAKHPYVILHELSHAYHDQVLNFENPKIIAAFEHSKQQGIYDDVLVHTGRRARHYALSNHKEYFAESTEAYLGVNDFYPFVRAELKEHDPTMHALLQQIWGKVE